MLGEGEQMRLVMALVAGQAGLPDGGPPEELFASWLGWCREARTRAAVVELVAGGDVLPSWEGGGWRFRLTERGEARAEELRARGLTFPA